MPEQQTDHQPAQHRDLYGVIGTRPCGCLAYFTVVSPGRPWYESIAEAIAGGAILRRIEIEVSYETVTTTPFGCEVCSTQPDEDTEPAPAWAQEGGAS